MKEDTKTTIKNGLEELMGLCYECFEIVDSGSCDNNELIHARVCDILGEIIPQKAGAMFNALLQESHPELVQSDNRYSLY